MTTRLLHPRHLDGMLRRKLLPVFDLFHLRRLIDVNQQVDRIHTVLVATGMSNDSVLESSSQSNPS
jgi:hypothetical protein